MLRHVFALVLLAAPLLPAFTQINPSEHFGRQLKLAQIEFIEPVEAGYKEIRGLQNEFLNADFVIRSRKERLEIRYAIEPLTPKEQAVSAPHVRAMRLVSHLATNDEEAVISAINIGETELREQFNADWGKVFIFTPKEKFTSYGQCKLLALFREGRGMAYVLFLFDKPGRELDYRFYALRFLDAPN